MRMYLTHAHNNSRQKLARFPRVLLRIYIRAKKIRANSVKKFGENGRTFPRKKSANFVFTLFRVCFSRYVTLYMSSHHVTHAINSISIPFIAHMRKYVTNNHYSHVYHICDNKYNNNHYSHGCIMYINNF